MWILPVSFKLDEIGKIYHYCPYCKKNTFHIVLGRIEDDPPITIRDDKALELED